MHIAFMFGLLPLCLIIHICMYGDVQKRAPTAWDFSQDLGILMLGLGYFDFI